MVENSRHLGCCLQIWNSPPDPHLFFFNRNQTSLLYQNITFCLRLSKLEWKHFAKKLKNKLSVFSNKIINKATVCDPQSLSTWLTRWKFGRLCCRLEIWTLQIINKNNISMQFQEQKQDLTKNCLYWLIRFLVFEDLITFFQPVQLLGFHISEWGAAILSHNKVLQLLFNWTVNSGQVYDEVLAPDWEFNYKNKVKIIWKYSHKITRI